MNLKILATITVFAVFFSSTVQASVANAGPLGTEITESGTFTGTVFNGALTDIPEMERPYFGWDWYWIDLDRFDILYLKLEMDPGVDFDLGVWHLVPGEELVVKSTNPPGATEEVEGVNPFSSAWQIFIGRSDCMPASASYTLTVEVERVREITESGTETGSLAPGRYIDIFDIYRVELQEDDYAAFTLDPPSTADFNLWVFCEECWKHTSGHEAHTWSDFLGVGETETLEIMGSSVPHDGIYYVSLIQKAGSGSYTLSSIVDRTPPSISDISYNPQSPQPTDVVTVTADITEADSGIKTVTLQYSTDGGATWTSAAMVSGDTPYTGTIPAHVDGMTVQFKIRAEDNAGLVTESPVTSYTVKALIFGLEPLMFYALIGGLVVVVLIVVFLLMRRKAPSPAPQPTPPPAPAAYFTGCGSLVPLGIIIPKCGRRIQ